ncbi:unnamed protein product [Caenorhabditis angaria]|uniref:mitogen-activated protein kinase kinase n=1 Tax=Caenorhabditis angaria TaxID=860376 RepID=A0A9P1IXB8_9PELO|nr:unnamed protein product [Caenorhabditis angaria]
MDRDFFSLGGLGMNNVVIPEPEPEPSRSNINQADLRRALEEAKLKSGKLLINGRIEHVDEHDLEQLAELGHGSCGTVTKEKYKSLVMAVKTMPTSSDSYLMSRILMDINVICQSFDCPYVVKCYGYFINDNHVKVCMEVMATCLDRLIQRVGPIPEPIIGKMTVSIINALHYLKTRHSIMHRDVKPSNILLDWSGVIKMCDFGIAGRLVASRALSKQAGCPLYMAPERVDPNNLEAYGIRSDVWSFGVTLVELATGQFPFHGKNDMERLIAIMRGDPPRLSVTDGFSPEFCNLVEICLQRNPENRPDYNQILNHPFLQYHMVADTNVEEWFFNVNNQD